MLHSSKSVCFSNFTCLQVSVFSRSFFTFCKIKQHTQSGCGLDIHLELHLDDVHLDLLDLDLDLYLHFYLDYLNFDLSDLHHHLHPKLLDLGDLYMELQDLPLDCNLAHLLDPMDLDLVSQVKQPQSGLLAKMCC